MADVVASTAAMAAAATEAEATTPLIRAACAGPEGAVRLEDLPSCPTAEATSRARGDEAAAEEEEEVSEEEVSEEETEKAASASLQSTAARNPSPLPYPSAEASKVLHLPSGERACRPEMVQVVIGSSKALTPPTTAASASNDDDDEELFPPLPLLPPVVRPEGQVRRHQRRRARRVGRHARALQAERERDAAAEVGDTVSRRDCRGGRDSPFARVVLELRVLLEHRAREDGRAGPHERGREEGRSRRGRRS